MPDLNDIFHGPKADPRTRVQNTENTCPSLPPVPRASSKARAAKKEKTDDGKTE